MDRQKLPPNMIIQRPSRFRMFVDRWGIRYAYWFAGLFGVGACAYWIAGQCGATLVLTYSVDATPSFWDCLYFSAVTVTSLGYGDVRPVGMGRAIAGIEVCAGLIIVGLWVASVASRFADVRLSSVHSQLIDERFKDDRANIERLSNEFLALARQTACGPFDDRFLSAGTESKRAVLDELFAATDGIARGLRHDVRERLFFETVGPRPLGRLLGAIAESINPIRVAIETTGGGFSSLADHAGNRGRLRQILERYEVIARCAKDHSPHQEHKESGELVLTRIADLYALA